MQPMSGSTSVGSPGGLSSQLLLLQLLNQLCPQQKNTPEHIQRDSQNCLHSLKQLINEHEDRYTKLGYDYLNLRNLHLKAGERIKELEDSLQESSKKCEEKIKELERQVVKETSDRKACESDAALQKELSKKCEEKTKELEREVVKETSDRKVCESDAALQKELSKKCEEETKELEREVVKETSDRKVCESDAALQKELSKKCEEKTKELERQVVKETSDRKVCESDAALQKEPSKKCEEKTKELERQVVKETSERMACESEAALQKDVAGKQISRAITFTKQYTKYLAAGKLSFAISVYGDDEIKRIFQPSENIIGKLRTIAEIRNTAIVCGNGNYVPRCFRCDGANDCGNGGDEKLCSMAIFPNGARVQPGEDSKLNFTGTGTVVKEFLHWKNHQWVQVRWDNGIFAIMPIKAGHVKLRAAAGYFC